MTHGARPQTRRAPAHSLVSFASREPLSQTSASRRSVERPRRQQPLPSCRLDESLTLSRPDPRSATGSAWGAFQPAAGLKEPAAKQWSSALLGEPLAQAAKDTRWGAADCEWRVLQFAPS